MVFTIDKTTNTVVMVSDGHNEYDNPNFIDVELTDDSIFETWRITGGDLAYNPDTGEIYILS